MQQIVAHLKKPQQFSRNAQLTSSILIGLQDENLVCIFSFHTHHNQHTSHTPTALSSKLKLFLSSSLSLQHVAWSVQTVNMPLFNEQTFVAWCWGFWQREEKGRNQLCVITVEKVIYLFTLANCCSMQPNLPQTAQVNKTKKAKCYVNFWHRLRRNSYTVFIKFALKFSRYF